MSTPKDDKESRRMVAKFWLTYIRVLEGELETLKSRVTELEALVADLRAKS